MMSEGYKDAAEELKNHIFNLIPENEEILKMEDPWALFKIKDFNNQEGLSFYQASWALIEAQNKFMNLKKGIIK